ncbi:MAG: hypothetical protein ABR956_17560 [Terracidiphilus sp.]
MKPDEIEQVENYRTKVARIFGEIFATETGRFRDGQRLLRRFNEAVDHALTGSPLRSVDEAHNELCIARALLLNTTPRFSSVAYEPPLTACAKSIDFCGQSSEGLTTFVDVKTIMPEPKDRWDQFEKAREEERFPNNHIIGLSKDWMGGEIWHGWLAGRGRMLEYTLELEEKIKEGGLKGRKDTILILALCGTGFHWQESQLEDFADFYRSGRHRSDDSFAKMEAHFIKEEKLSLERTVTAFACMHRKRTAVLPTFLHWNVGGPADPERLFLSSW